LQIAASSRTTRTRGRSCAAFSFFSHNGYFLTAILPVHFRSILGLTCANKYLQLTKGRLSAGDLGAHFLYFVPKFPLFYIYIMGVLYQKMHKLTCLFLHFISKFPWIFKYI
jgi:hypothetical protein